MRLHAFGDKKQPVHIEFPTQKDLQEFPLDRQIKLRGIAWKNNTSLSGLQLLFTNGVKSPMFQKDAVSQIEPTGFWAIKSCEIDAAKSISRISMKVKKSTNQLCAMKLSDDKGEVIAETKWFNDTKAEWINRNIPAG